MSNQSKLANLSFKITTKNIRGFLHETKISKYFDRAKKYFKTDILCLQETNIGPARANGRQMKDVQRMWTKIQNGDQETEDSSGTFCSTSDDGKQSTITLFSTEFQLKCCIHNKEVTK